MRLTRPRFPRRGGRSTLARLAAVAGVVGMICVLAWPPAATGQESPEVRPTGIYGVTIGRLDLPPGLAGGPALVGQWTMTFNDDDTYEVARQDVGVLAAGSFEITGATLNIGDWSGLLGCGGTAEEPSTASYAWELAGDELRLTAIQDTCAERKILLETRGFGRFEPCTTEPLEGLGGLPGPPAPPGPPTPATTPGAQGASDILPGVGQPAATPLAEPVPEGTPAGADVEAAIESLLRQATGCWATGEPGRFLALHSQVALDQVPSATGGSVADFAVGVAQLMSTPVSFELIDTVELTDPTHATAYVEITFGSEPIPQRFTFAQEGGVWLLDSIFVLGPPQAAPTPEP